MADHDSSTDTTDAELEAALRDVMPAAPRELLEHVRRRLFGRSERPPGDPTSPRTRSDRSSS